MNPEAEPFTSALMRQRGAPDLEDAETAHGDTETNNGGVAADEDGESNTAEPGEGLQESSEEDDPAPRQPPATHSVREIVLEC